LECGVRVVHENEAALVVEGTDRAEKVGDFSVSADTAMAGSTENTFKTKILAQ
jgi:hypothetical protein